MNMQKRPSYIASNIWGGRFSRAQESARRLCTLHKNLAPNWCIINNSLLSLAGATMQVQTRAAAVVERWHYMLAKRITGIGNLNEYINGVEVKSCKFLKRELAPAAWNHYKKELEIGNKFFKDGSGRFFGLWTGETELFFIGGSVDAVNDYLLWE